MIWYENTFDKDNETVILRGIYDESALYTIQIILTIGDVDRILFQYSITTRETPTKEQIFEKYRNKLVKFINYITENPINELKNPIKNKSIKNAF